MTDLRALLTRAGEVLKPIATVAEVSSPHWHQWVTVCVYIGDCRRARALHAEITAALAAGETANPCTKILDFPWLDPECVSNGCQSLVLRGQPAPSPAGAMDNGFTPRDWV